MPTSVGLSVTCMANRSRLVAHMTIFIFSAPYPKTWMWRYICAILRPTAANGSAPSTTNDSIGRKDTRHFRSGCRASHRSRITSEIRRYITPTAILWQNTMICCDRWGWNRSTCNNTKACISVIHSCVNTNTFYSSAINRLPCDRISQQPTLYTL